VLKTLLPIDNDVMMVVMVLIDAEFHVSCDASNDNKDKHTM
jgi:hypothetical protein